MPVQRVVREKLRHEPDGESGDAGNGRSEARLRSGSPQEIDDRPDDEEDILLPDHSHERAGETEDRSAARRPRTPYVQPHCDEQRDRERGTRVRKRRRDVHIKKEGRADPHRDSFGERRPEAGDHPRRADREQDGDESVEGGPVCNRGDVRFRKAVQRNILSRRVQRPRHEIPNRIERGPQDRAPDRPEIDPPPRFRCPLEKRLVKALGLRDVVLVEVAVLVLERYVTIEPQRSQIREVLDLIRGIEAWGDGRQ
jgi:hypothetical protein